MNIILNRIKPWHLILIGIGMNILASVLTHVTIENKLTHLSDIKNQISILDGQIDSLWQRNIEAERKKEFSSLLFSVEDNQNNAILTRTGSAHQLLFSYFDSIATDLKPEMRERPRNSEELIERIKLYQIVVRDQIDDLYFDRLQLSEGIGPIEKDINFNKNISLFLQLMGLILVLSRDLARQ